MPDNTIYNSGSDYDQQYSDYTRDLDFILQLAERYGGSNPIAEFACGTGRITIPLAQAGHSVTGVDITPAMLSEARRKVSQLEWSNNSGKIQLLEGDMRSYHTPYYHHHHLVLVPFTAFLHMTSQEDQIAALKNFWGHLSENGHLLVDIFNPRMDRLGLDPSQPQSPKVEKQIPINNGSQLLVRSVLSQYMRATQHVRWCFFVDIYDTQTGEKLRSYREEATVQPIFPNEWRLLLKTTGFTIEKEWGDYQNQPFTDDSSRMLFLARKTHQPVI